MEVTLVMFKADGTRRDFPMNKSRVVVGRTNSCDLRIPLSSVSREHCEFTLDDDELRVRDLGSSNGTFQNGIRVQESSLDKGDEVAIGPVVFTVVIDGEPGSIEPVRTIVDAEDAEAAEPDEQAPKAISTSDGDMPADSGEGDSESPTVELDEDEDPISALEALADADDDGLPGLGDDDDDR